MRRVAGVDVDEPPVADGGEGTALVLDAARSAASAHAAVVATRSAAPSTASWLVLPDGTAVVECAQAAGLPRLAPHELDPLRASSRGLGELLLAALAGARGHCSLRRRHCNGRRRRRACEPSSGTRSPTCRYASLATFATRCSENAARRASSARRRAPSAEAVLELESRLASLEELAPFATEGAGAGGGLGAGLAALGGSSSPARS